MSLTDTIKEDMKTAMKAKEATKVTTLRGVMSAFTNELVAMGKMPQDALTDDQALAVIKREAKKRKDAIGQFEAANRPELAADEQVELEILEEYLPEMLSIEKITPVVEAKIAELGITDASGMGQLMGAVMAELGAAADGNDVKEVAMNLLKS